MGAQNLRKTYATALAATPGAVLIAAVTGCKIKVNRITIALTDAADVVLTDGSAGTELARLAIEADKQSVPFDLVNCLTTAGTALYVFCNTGTPTPSITVEYDTVPSP